MKMIRLVGTILLFAIMVVGCQSKKGLYSKTPNILLVDANEPTLFDKKSSVGVRCRLNNTGDCEKIGEIRHSGYLRVKNPPPGVGGTSIGSMQFNGCVSLIKPKSEFTCCDTDKDFRWLQVVKTAGLTQWKGGESGRWYFDPPYRAKSKQPATEDDYPFYWSNNKLKRGDKLSEHELSHNKTILFPPTTQNKDSSSPVSNSCQYYISDAPSKGFRPGETMVGKEFYTAFVCWSEENGTGNKPLLRITVLSAFHWGFRSNLNNNQFSMFPDSPSFLDLNLSTTVKAAFQQAAETWTPHEVEFKWGCQ